MAETILYQVDDNCSKDEFPDLVQEAQASLAGFKPTVPALVITRLSLFLFSSLECKGCRGPDTQVFLKVMKISSLS